MRAIHMAAAALAIVCAARLASAQGPDETGVPGWFELNTHRQPSTPEDGLFLDRTRVLEAWQLGLGAQLQVDDDPLVWQREEEGAYEETGVEVERLVALHLNAAMGLFGYAQIGVQLPVYLDKGKPRTTAGVGDARLTTKGSYIFHPGSVDLGLGLSVPISFPSGDETSFSGEGRIAVEPRLVLDLLVDRVRLALNAGALLVEESCAWGLCRGHEIILGLGADVLVLDGSDRLVVTAEAGLSTQASDPFGRASTPAEILGGARYRIVDWLSISGALGAGVSPGVGSSDFRLLVGLGIVPSPFGGDPAEEEAATAGTETEDSDLDGLADAEDLCPEEAEDYDQYEDDDGCPEADNDGDGVPDPADRCPLEAENANGIDDDDGCPEGDLDGDRVADDRDACPLDPEDLDGNEDGDGCPDEDDDRDGVPDAKDECPNLAESLWSDAARDGCPDSLRVEGNRVVLERRIRFARRKAEILEEGERVLEDLARAADLNPSWIELEILVHTSGRGGPVFDQRLSEKRAMEIIKTLVRLGVESDRLVAEGLGDQEPLAPPDTPEGRRSNERVEITIVRGDSR